MNETTPDGTASWELGQDSWQRPDRIQQNQYVKGVNLSVRGGKITPRAAYVQIPLQFENKSLTNSRRESIKISDIWKYGKYQAYIPTKTEQGRFVITIVSGYIFRTDIATMSTELVSDTIKCSANADRVNWTYADDSIVIFDYPSRPIIINDDGIRESDPEKNEVPIAALGVFNQSRLIIANAVNQFTAGDVVGNLNTPNAPLTFNEIFQPNSAFINQIFSVSSANPLTPITAMGLLQSIDSSTGIGPLFIATENEVYYYATNQPREQWEATQFGSLLLSQAGIAGPRAFINVNSDLVFLSPEGKVHTFSSAQEAAKKWGNVPISREVQNYLKVTDSALTKYSVLAYHDNRIYISAYPYRTKAVMYIRLS